MKLTTMKLCTMKLFAVLSLMLSLLLSTFTINEFSAAEQQQTKPDVKAEDKPENKPKMTPSRLFGDGSAKKLEQSQKTLQQRLAEAALERTKDLVIYNPQYFKIPYPNGDVPAHFGVCTDVIIRAYRTIGIDLQKDVHQKMGGDRNIAHRRVKVLEKFFARYGKSLPVTNNPEDYKPGDIVTYYLDKAVSSRDHIAIVSDKVGTSGAPMIIHNIGLGPKLDDDLFSFKITGHYRYNG